MGSNGLRQCDIAKSLGWSQTKVSRLLTGMGDVTVGMAFRIQLLTGGEVSALSFVASELQTELRRTSGAYVGGDAA